MMAKRVIPCLDVHDGKVTRGVQFGVAEKGGLRNVGDPVELALRYNEQGADEMVFFDITATAHGRGTMVDVIERAADQCFMPLTAGGGIKSVEDMYTMLRAGADKTSINSSALARPELIREGAEKFGGNYRAAPTMSDRLQGTGNWSIPANRGQLTWSGTYNNKFVQFASHRGPAGTPSGGQFLFEDGHVEWFPFRISNARGSIDVGSMMGGWVLFYKIPNIQTNL